LVGVDVIDWLDPDLRGDVELSVGAAETTLGTAQRFDRVLLIETIEHLEAPWTVLRIAADLVQPGGRLVVSTPNIATLRHRIELAARGELTSFRPGNDPHLGPILPHVTSRVLSEQGLKPHPPIFAGRDIVPKSRGRLWPALICRQWSRALSISVVIGASRPSPATSTSAHHE
jgi:SAM-dependent methyltransferase